MAVRAKFYVSEKKESANHPNPNYPTQKMHSVMLLPVNGNSDENKEFFKWTPTGKIEMGILNPATAELFEVGKEIYVDFTPADSPISD